MLFLFENYKSHRKTLFDNSKFRTQSIYAGLSHLDSDMTKREKWTEEDVKSLAFEEPDYFERKAGQLFSQNKGDFLCKLAKTVSAFANTGGGHILLGVRDDNTFDGMPPQEGKTSMKDWLEQTIPYLVDYSLSDFRVHTVLPAAQSSIPTGRVIIVVDVGDSSLAPHQSKRDKTYYYRCAGRSEPAPHFYLELLRQRLIHPTLKLELKGLELEDAYPTENGIFLEAMLRFRVRNVGRVAAYKWDVIPMGLYNLPDDRESDYHISLSTYPIKKRRTRSLRIDDTILPECGTDENTDLGVLLKPKSLAWDKVYAEVQTCITNIKVKYRLPTETSPGESFDFAIQEVVSTEEITKFIMAKCQDMQATS
jgi:hypothetical protein